MDYDQEPDYDFDENEPMPCIDPDEMELEALYGTDEHSLSLTEARDLGVSVDEMNVEFGNYSEWEE